MPKSKVSQFDYAKDKRSSSKYRSDTEIGQYNQQLALEQLRIDRYLEGRILDFSLNPDKEFQDDTGSWTYQPDYVVFYDNKSYPTEVKVQMTELKDTIDIKLNQIIKLKEQQGVVLYATKSKYSLTRASAIYKLGTIVESERFGGKKVVQVEVSKLNWQLWIHKPEFRNYARI